MQRQRKFQKQSESDTVAVVQLASVSKLTWEITDFPGK